MSFVPTVSEPIAHSLHVLAYMDHGEPLSPGYERLDRRLRRGGRAPRRWRLPDGAAVTAAGALHAREAPTLDSRWFGLRWLGGEETASRQHAERLATEANAFDAAGLLPRAEIALIASPAVTRRGIAVPDPWVVALHPRARGLSAVLATVAARLEPDLEDLELPVPDRRFLALQLAGCALYHAREESGRPDWLASIADDLLPTKERSARWADQLLRIADQVLDQPPGEVERITRGLADRRPERLERAWRRAFFAPAGWDLAAWIGSCSAKDPERSAPPAEEADSG